MPGGGPPPHRHDFEEMFHVLQGEIELTFRGEKSVERAGETANVPANAPHSLTNASDRPARLLCVCSPPWQGEFDEASQAAFLAKARELAPKYRTELLGP